LTLIVGLNSIILLSVMTFLPPPWLIGFCILDITAIGFFTISLGYQSVKKDISSPLATSASIDEKYDVLLKKYNDSVTENQNFITQLKSQYTLHQEELISLDAQILKAYSTGKTQEAAQLAKQHASLEQQIANLKQQLLDTETIYEKLLKIHETTFQTPPLLTDSA